jgi:hypothetical protein
MRIFDPHTPTTRPRDDGTRLQKRWDAARAVHIPDVLRPGLAAEIDVALRPMCASLYSPRSSIEQGLYHRCDVQLPSELSPRTPKAFFRLKQLLDVDLPRLIGEVTGTTLRPARSGVMSLWTVQKGSWYTRAASRDQTGIVALLELTGGRWPEAWGGHLRSGTHRWPPGWDQLTVLPADAPLEITLLTRHVSATWLHVPLELG